MPTIDVDADMLEISGTLGDDGVLVLYGVDGNKLESSLAIVAVAELDVDIPMTLSVPEMLWEAVALSSAKVEEIAAAEVEDDALDAELSDTAGLDCSVPDEVNTCVIKPVALEEAINGLVKMEVAPDNVDTKDKLMAAPALLSEKRLVIGAVEL